MATIHSFSQKIPNAGFEKWKFVNQTHLDLEEWKTNAGDVSIKVIPAHGYASKFGLELNGAGYARTKFYCTSVPQSLKAYIKSEMQQNDTARIHISFYSGKSKVKTIKWHHSTTIDDWTLINIVFAEIPASPKTDSIEIELFGGKEWLSPFYIDELSFEYESSTQQSDIDDRFTVYPNPFTSQTSLEIVNMPNNAKFLITNSQGKLVKEIHHIDHVMMIDRHDLEKGVYFISLIQNNTILSTKKMIVVD